MRTLKKTRGKELVPESKSKIEDEKVGPKWGQSGAADGAKVGPEWGQSGAKKNLQKNKVGPQLGPKSKVKWGQSGAKVGPNLRFCMLVGVQKKIMETIFLEAFKAGQRFSPQLSLDFISSYSKTSKSSLKKAIKRLIEKKLLIRGNYKNGRGGWTEYEIPNDVFTEMLQIESGANVGPKWGQSGAADGAKVGPQLGPNSSRRRRDLNFNEKSSSSDFDESNEHDPFSLRSVIIPDVVRKAGFTENHLAQIEKMEKISPEDMQEYLYHFEYELKDENNKMDNPLSYFMYSIKNTASFSSGRYAKAMGAKIDDENKLIRQIRDQRKKEKEETEEFLFSEWLKTRTKEEIKALVPLKNCAYMSPMHRGMVKAYFLHNLMPSFKEKFFKEGQTNTKTKEEQQEAIQ